MTEEKKRKKGSEKENIVQAILMLHETTGELSFNAKKIHEVAGGNLHSIGAMLSKMVLAGALERPAKGQYVCTDPVLVRNYKSTTKRTKKGRSIAFSPADIPEKELPDSLEEIQNRVRGMRQDIDWVFDTYIPWLEEMLRSMMGDINWAAEKAKQCKIYHLDRLTE